jgi:hypothetical protein
MRHLGPAAPLGKPAPTGHGHRAATGFPGWAGGAGRLFRPPHETGKMMWFFTHGKTFVLFCA